MNKMILLAIAWSMSSIAVVEKKDATAHPPEIKPQTMEEFKDTQGEQVPQSQVTLPEVPRSSKDKEGYLQGAMTRLGQWQEKVSLLKQEDKAKSPDQRESIAKVKILADQISSQVNTLQNSSSPDWRSKARVIETNFDKLSREYFSLQAE
jgi:hypothetical protein